MVEIRAARPGDLPQIWALVRRAVLHMNQLGNPQWGADYPTRALYAGDIRRGELYAACAPGGAILGVACINQSTAPEYDAVPWAWIGPAGCVHRAAVDPAAQRQGVASALLDFAETWARREGLRALHADTYSLNHAMQALFVKRGYAKRGAVSLRGRPLPYPCFEKLLPAGTFGKAGENMKKLLVIVDYQKDFVDGALGFPGAEALDEGIARRAQAYRDNGDDVVFTLDTHQSDYSQTQEGRKLPPLHCLQGSEGWALYGQVGAQAGPEELRFEKPAFPSLALAEWLKGRDYGQVELCGLVSHICVLTNAVMVKAALPEAEILVDAALTASYDPVLHEKALDVLEGIQVTVSNRRA